MGKCKMTLLVILLSLFARCDPAGAGTPEQQQKACFNELFAPLVITVTNSTTFTTQEKQGMLAIGFFACYYSKEF